MKSMSIPEDVLASIKIPMDDLEKILKLELVLLPERHHFVW